MIRGPEHPVNTNVSGCSGPLIIHRFLLNTCWPQFPQRPWLLIFTTEFLASSIGYVPVSPLSCSNSCLSTVSSTSLVLSLFVSILSTPLLTLCSVPSNYLPSWFQAIFPIEAPYPLSQGGPPPPLGSSVAR